MIMYQKPIMHGDVDILPIESIPDDAKLSKSDLVMHGENGHSHIIHNGQILLSQGRKFIKSSSNTYLVHEEHRKTSIPEGIFEVLIEQDFDPFRETIMRVRD